MSAQKLPAGKFCIFFLFVCSCVAYSQNKPDAALQKFEFMSGEFKERKSEGTVTGAFSPDGKEFRWEYRNGGRVSVGVVTYGAKAKKYFLTETVNGTIVKHYEGIETQHGFPFRALMEKGGQPDEKGEVIQLVPIPAGLALPVKMVNMVRLRKNAEGKYEKFYEGDYYAPLTDEQFNTATIKGLKRLDFLVGNFKELDRDNTIEGKFTENGAMVVLTYKSARSIDTTVISYNFHRDQFSLLERNNKAAPSGTKYTGTWQDGKLVLVANATPQKQFILSAPALGKIALQRKFSNNMIEEKIFAKAE